MEVVHIRRPAPESASPSSDQYLIGVEDIIEVSVFGQPDLGRTQAVRPDGKLSLPLIGDVQANGLSPAALQETITAGLRHYYKDPKVNVIIREYRNRKVYILGQVRAPGLLRLETDITLLEALSLAGGITERANLSEALLVRDGQIVPVDFYALLKKGNFKYNIRLQTNDAILIPDFSARRLYVLGEVQRPGVQIMDAEASLLEAITAAGGFTLEASQSHVILLRGGLADPTLYRINVRKLLRGQLVQNLALIPGDVIYVPSSFIADMTRVFARISTLLTPLLLAENGIVLGPDVKAVLTTGETISQRVLTSPPSIPLGNGASSLTTGSGTGTQTETIGSPR